MYKKMLVLLDGSELAEVVFNYARELSGRLDIDLDLLHVVTPQEEDQLPMRRAYMEHMAQVLCEGAQEISASTSPGDTQSCILSKGTVVVGYPAEEILKYIDANSVDLVMMSTHGKSGPKTWDIGSVANKVIHAAEVPVWLVPSELRDEIVEDSLPTRRLVIPLSGSETTEVAIPYALGLAKQRGAETEIVLLHVAEFGLAVYSRESMQGQEADRAKAKEYLEKVAERIRAEGFTVRTELLTGDPAASIIEYIRHNPPQLLAMATRGRKGLSKLVFGSVTEEVIHLMKKTPMLLVSASD